MKQSPCQIDNRNKFNGLCILRTASGLTGIVSLVTQLGRPRRAGVGVYADRTTTQACDLAFRLLQMARARLLVTPKACRR